MEERRPDWLSVGLEVVGRQAPWGLWWPCRCGNRVECSIVAEFCPGFSKRRGYGLMPHDVWAVLCRFADCLDGPAVGSGV